MAKTEEGRRLCLESGSVEAVEEALDRQAKGKDEEEEEEGKEEEGGVEATVQVGDFVSILYY